MSTYWGYVCRSHDPEIESEHWFNRGAALLADVFRKERAGEWPNNPDYEPGGQYELLGPLPSKVTHSAYETAEPVTWLRQHPRCDVALRSEYGDTREVADAP